MPRPSLRALLALALVLGAAAPHAGRAAPAASGGAGTASPAPAGSASASAAPGGATAAASPALVAYARATEAATRSVRDALPRLAACTRPSLARVVFEVTLAEPPGTPLSPVRVRAGGGASGGGPSCMEKVLQDVFTRARPAVGVEAAVVLTTSGTVALEGDVALLGRLSPEAVESGIRERVEQVSLCYVAGLDQAPELEGRLTVAFTVLPDGRAHGPAVRQDTLLHGGVARCVLEQVAAASFPAPEGGGIARVSYPFVFQPPR